MDAEDNLGYTPLHLAAWNGHLKVVEFLKDKAKLDATSKDGQTPLHVAAQWGHLDVVKALARHKADIFAKDHQNGLAIHYAARKGHDQLVEYLLTTNPKLLTEPGTASRTVLHEAATLGDLKLVQLLVQKNIDLKSNLLNMKSEDSETALHAAVNQGHLAIVQCLVANDVPIDAKDKDGQTAEDLAKELGKHDIVKFMQQIRGREEIEVHPNKDEERKAAMEVAEIAQPGPIPALKTPGGQQFRNPVPRANRKGYRVGPGR